jgi:hypothetical protein
MGNRDPELASDGTVREHARIMIIVSTPSATFSLGDLTYILADGIYIHTPSGPAKIPGVPLAEVAAVKAWADGSLTVEVVSKHSRNPAESITTVVIPVPAAPAGGPTP